MLNIYFDNQGLIVQTNGDGGDCAARTGELYIGIFLTNNDYIMGEIPFQAARELLEPTEDGILLRYNMFPYNDPFHGDFATSRDQTVPMIIAAGFYRELDFLKRLLAKQLKRFMLFQNKDIASPENIGQYIRAFHKAGSSKAKWFYPLLLLGDLFMLLNVVIRCIKGRDPNDVGDDINTTQSVLQAVYSLPTPISWLARKLYAKLRPGYKLGQLGLIRDYSINGPQFAFDWYHRPETGGNPLNELYRPLIKKWLT